ncbi:uncharacterized protein ISCGN_014542 [Ixodes scapularis]
MKRDEKYECNAFDKISAISLDTSQTDKKEQSVPDDDEAVASNNTSLNPQDVLINVTAKQDAASVYNITIHKVNPSSNVSVRVKSCGMGKCTPGIATPIFKQSDYLPFFEVLNVTMTSFEVRVTPSRYSHYQVRYCNKNGVCKTIFTPGSVSIVDLMPGTTYTVNVREGLRDANGQFILGPAARTRVSTRRNDSCVYNITGPHGRISSPNYPNIYPNSASCSWLIKTNPDFGISLEFNDFELEKDNKCITDYVSVYDGNDTSAPILGTYCGNTAPLPILSSSNQIYMVFVSDNEVQGKGFSATYTQVEKDRVAKRGSEQSIYSHAEYGNQLYENNIDRHWVIKAPDGHVRLRFIAFDIEAHDSCGFDYVKVFDGGDESAPLLNIFCGNQEFNDFELEKDNKCITDYVSVYDGNDTSAPILGTYCGNTAPLPILSSSNQIYMVFVSDNEVQGKGFSATYTQVEKDRVAKRGSEQSIYSHAEYGNQLYENKVDRDWVIRAPDGHVRLRFIAFDIEAHDSCGFDYVKVFDGGDESAPLLNIFCGNQLPREITSSSDSLLLRFHTDQGTTKSGFVALYSAVE